MIDAFKTGFFIFSVILTALASKLAKVSRTKAKFVHTHSIEVGKECINFMLISKPLRLVHNKST
jgi:hypothetical protein